MPVPRFKKSALACILFFLVVFVIVLLQELIVLDNFEYHFRNATTSECRCETAGQINGDQNGHDQINLDQIDLVYTWVNGSDPTLKRLIQQYQQLNRSDHCDQFVKSPFLLVIPEVIPKTHSKLLANIPADGGKDKRWVPVNYEIKNDVSSSLFYFEDLDRAQEYLIRPPSELTNYKVHQLYFLRTNCGNQTDDQKTIKLRNAFRLDRRKMDEGTKDKFLKDVNEILVSDKFKVKSIPPKPDHRKPKNVIDYQFEFEHYEIVGLDSRFNVNGIETLANYYAKHEIEFGEQQFEFRLVTSDLRLNAKDDAYGENRFSDKDELRYSLRSVEKFANWVRNIYVVTNGQVPNWLNTSHPRIKLVNHSQIYTNQSHLPTFNSASIECHLHRIEGLSKRFLYLNDDFLFGRPVYPEDFYSRSKGHQIRLGWNSPNCANNCPTTWLQDGICDKACNTSLCLFDGGDCLKTNKKENRVMLDENISTFFGKPVEPSYRECTFGCPVTWLADEHCDSQCNNRECGYDLGDCKLNELDNAFSAANYYPNQSEYKFNLTAGQTGVYLNLTDHFRELTIVKQVNELKQLQANNQMHVKRLAFNQMHNLLFLLLDKPSDQTKVFLNLAFKLNAANSSTNLALEINYDQATNPTRRKLMDFYGDSLKYSNYVISKRYSIQIRKVPAHMPMLLDREVLERMNVALYDEIQETSSHRFRESSDLQFAFTYYHFLMSEQLYPTLAQILAEFDSDQDGRLNRNEARSFYLSASKDQFEEKNFEKFWNDAVSCAGKRHPDRPLSIAALTDCSDFEFLSDEMKVRKRNKYTVLKMDDVSFNQISDDVQQLQSQLDKLRKSPTQFICINDNFSYGDARKARTINAILHDFFEAILPIRSQFENQPPTSDNLGHEADRKPIGLKSPIPQNVNYRQLLLVFVAFCACVCLFSRFCYNQSKAKFSAVNTV